MVIIINIKWESKYEKEDRKGKGGQWTDKKKEGGHGKKVRNFLSISINLYFIDSMVRKWYKNAKKNYFH